MADDVIDLLRELIAIDSVNPSLISGASGEKQIAQMVAVQLRKFGLEVEIQEVRPGRPNVIGILEGRASGRALMLCGHLDTVGVAGMDAPFQPVERNGRLYGRGAQDMKGGVAAMISVARSLAQSGTLAAGKLIIAAVVDEEYASIGTAALVKKWLADGAVVLEPTDLIIGTAHKGFSWIEVTIRGRAAHGSRPLEGRDAILRMGRFLNRLESLNQKLQSGIPHTLLGNPSLHASLIQGGKELSTYPDHCVVQFERRTICREPEEAALRETEKILEELKREDPEFLAEAKFLFGQPSYEIPHGHALPDLIEAELKRQALPAQRGGMTFWTDAAILGKAGIPSVVFGPGGAGLHGLEEYVKMDEVITCRDVLIEVTRSFCASS